ncbi:hypothetical protein HGRIS_012475 [Hohenbuehelia grisea]|uniref:BHLH domain-containing protein n=1 Tax=Hohenbuehelia grisea TaxID=104357 RepID=A0ABR3ISD8_9AGAR
MSGITSRNPYERSVNPTRRAKHLSHPLDDYMSASETDGEQDNDRDSDFHPGVPLAGHATVGRARSTSIAQSAATGHAGPRHTVPILPKVNTSTTPVQIVAPSLSPVATSPTTTAPARRGRKPGGMSRSAREAQRKLNHSIIEKARRTKINETLATLRELVPADYGRHKGDEDEDDDDDGVDEKGKGRAKGRGKKEEKEREFKLEILVRTVAFMKDLLERVKVLEESQDRDAGSSGAPLNGRKRKRNATDEYQYDGAAAADTPKSQASECGRSRKARRESGNARGLPRGTTSDCLSTDEAQASHRPPPPARLPSISSWLPAFASDNNLNIDPTLLVADPGTSQDRHNATQRHDEQGKHVAYLPSPPPSHRFRPTPGAAAPPNLTLGASYNEPKAHSVGKQRQREHTPPSESATGGREARTPEDESAASLLLEISLSPTILPTLSSASVSAERLSLSPPSSGTSGMPRDGKYATVHPPDNDSALLLRRMSFGQYDTQMNQREDAGTARRREAIWEDASEPAKHSELALNQQPAARSGEYGGERERSVSYDPPDRQLDPTELATRMMKPQTPSMLLGLGGAQRVLARAGLGAKDNGSAVE